MAAFKTWFSIEVSRNILVLVHKLNGYITFLKKEERLSHAMLTLFGLKTLLASQPKTSPGKKPSVTFDLLIEKANVIRKEENDVKQRNANHSGNKDVPQSLPSTSPSLSYSINHSHSARSEILRLGSDTGILCSKFLRYAPMDGDQVSSRSRFWKTDSPEKDEISFAMGNIILTLIMISQLCKLDLCVCIQKKILLNAKKYPVRMSRFLCFQLN